MNHFVEVNNTKLYYECKGEGEPLLLVHGLPIDSRMWDSQFEELALHYKVIRFDLAGYGMSGVHNEDCSYLEDIRVLLDQLGIPKTSILGCSVGGKLAIDFYLQYPERVDSLVLVSSGLNGWTKISAEKEEFDKVFTPYFQSFDKENISKLLTKAWVAGPFRQIDEISEEVSVLFAKMIDNSLSKERGTGRFHFPSYVAIDYLNKIDIPTLIITSEFDFPEYIEIANYLNSQIKHSKLISFQGAGHMLNMEKPKEFTEAVLNFLNSKTVQNEQEMTN